MVSMSAFQAEGTGSSPVRRSTKALYSNSIANSLMVMTFSFHENYMGSIPILQKVGALFYGSFL